MHDSWTCPIPSPTLVLSSTLRACCSPLCLLAQLKSRPVSSYISPNGGCSWLGKRERFLQLTWFFNFFLLFFSCNEIISYLNKKKKKKKWCIEFNPTFKSCEQVTNHVGFFFFSLFSFILSLFFFSLFTLMVSPSRGVLPMCLWKNDRQSICRENKQTNN